MTDYKQVSKAFLKEMFEEAAARRGLPPTSVEKDWWVCLILEALYSNSTFSNYIIRVLQHRKIYFFYSWLNYETMKPGSFLLVPPENRVDFWRLDYDKLRNEMIYGQAPQFSELLMKLESIQNRINSGNF